MCGNLFLLSFIQQAALMSTCGSNRSLSKPFESFSIMKWSHSLTKGDWDCGTHSIMSSMVWLMICFTLSVSSSAIPCRPMLNDASLVLPSYLWRGAFLFSRRQTHTFNLFPGLTREVDEAGAEMRVSNWNFESFSYTPYNRGEVASYLGFDQSFVEGRVWPRDHQLGEKAESESLKRVRDAG